MRSPKGQSSRPTRSPARFLIGAAIGSGNTALAAERGGADFLLAINAGRLRNMGAPSIACMLPIFNARSLTERFAAEELLALCRVPVLLGIDVWGEACVPAEEAVRVRDAGFAGAVNFPSNFLYSRAMRQLLSRAGRGIEREIEVLRAVQDLGLTSMFYCATRSEARLAADVGLDLICLDLGWNVGGAMGHRPRGTVEEAAVLVREVGRLIKRINPSTRFLLAGGPIATANDLGWIANLAPIDGYVGGSTIDRMPLETSVADQIEAFRQAGRNRAAFDAESARLVTWGGRLGFVGHSPPLLAFLRRLRAIAGARARQPVLVLTEPGIDAGPVLGAFAHPTGRQRPAASVEIDVAGEDSPVLARRRLFGDAESIAQRRPLLADEEIDLVVIHAPERLPGGMQRRLARALREGVFRAQGLRRPVAVVPRVVLVSDRRIATDLVAAGFDADLVDVLKGWTLDVPPLRDRIDDQTGIIDSLAAANGPASLASGDFSSEALQCLRAHTWPGNEAELKSVLGALIGRGVAGPVQPREVTPLLLGATVVDAAGRTEKARIVDALWRNGFNRTRTAAALGISRKTLFNKIRKYELAG